MTATREPDPSYLAALPRVRTAAGALFTDATGRVLAVRTTYGGWEIPGGTVERDESPYAACAREVAEELGFAPRLGPLLCLDWVPPEPPRDGALMMVFGGGRLSAAQLAGIRLQVSELDRWELLTRAELADRMVGRLARRIVECLRMRAHGGAVFLEDGRRVTG